MNFNNVQNKCEELKDGRKVWISRSNSVNALILVEEKGTLKDYHYGSKFLLVKRSDKMNEGGKWCMPCGYLDWNESLEDAVAREIYEETGIKEEALKSLICDEVLRKASPVVTSQLNSTLQNVEHTYVFGLSYDWSANKYLSFKNLKFVNGQATNLPEHILDEVSEIGLFTFDDVLNSKMDIAFNHKEIIMHCLALVEINRIKKTQQ